MFIFMEYIKRYWHLMIILILLIVVGIMYYQIKQRNKSIINLRADNTLLTQSMDSFKNKHGEVIYEQEVALYEKHKKLEELTKNIFDLERKNSRLVAQVNYYGQIIQNTSLDSIFITYNDTVYVDTMSRDIIRVPKTFSVSTEHYGIAGTVLKEGVSLDNISVSNTLTYREIEKKNGWFKPTTTVVQVHNSNPYVSNLGMTSVSVKHKPNAWNMWIKPTLTALGASFVTYQIVK